ncbi:MAG: L,D-transpeptidase [Thermoleophilia bacterium]|nr:L,D-transpeptidase [Thermoleophilia bacterium]MDH3724478.1 L,D-transpeptidase [Thermoleophilia bacterium]
MPRYFLPVALAAAVVGFAASDALAAKKLHGPNVKGAWAGELVAPTVVRAAPKNKAKRIARLSPVGPIGGDGTAMLVTGAKKTKGVQWVRLLLPERPNGKQGWVKGDSVRLVRRRTRVVINRNSHRLTLFRGRKRILATTVVLGRPGTPTPKGLHAIAENINTNAPSSFLGPRVLALTAHSETINFFRGGKGRVAIHGTNRPDLLGTRASLGCVRVNNTHILRLARLAPPGTPVLVR